MQRTNLIRVFMADGVQLADPDPTASVQDAVRILAACGRPDLATAEIRGPEAKAGRSVYTLHRAVGTKGRITKRSAAMLQRLSHIDKVLGFTPDDHAQSTGVAKAFSVVLSRKGQEEGSQQLTLPAACLPCLG